MQVKHRLTRSHQLLHRLITNSPLTAVRFVRRMRGSSQACLIQCDDGDYYVVKFANNPKGPNLLANEMLGSLLCDSIGMDSG